MDKMTGADMVKEWLRDHGYDGLVNGDCGCSLDDFMPCEECCCHCKSAYKWADGLMHEDKEPK